MIFRRKNFVLCLILVLMSSLLAYVFVNGSSGASLENAVYVKNEDELKNAVNNAPSKETIIILDNDITLSESALTIPYNKDVTLTSNRSSGFYKLIGVANKAVIVVDGGVLKLDGILVSGGGDSGIHVRDNGVLVMYDGEISGNTGYISENHPGYVGVGGGVSIRSGVFEMYGGKISNNRAHSYGGGVDIGLGGATFSMFGGTISGNTAEYGGGGVFNSGNFSMFGGTISGNTAEYGGGVYTGGGNTNFDMSGGVISGNTATIEGNDVYLSGGGSSNGSGSGDGGGSSNGNGGSGGSGGGGGSGSGGGSFNGGGGGFGLRDIVFVCVGVAVVVVGVVVAVLLFTVKKELKSAKGTNSVSPIV